MSSEHPSDNRLPVAKAPSEAFERYDLSGNQIRRWTTRAVEILLVNCRRVFAFGKHVGTANLPGANSSVAEKAKKAPGKGMEFLEARLDQAPIENQLKVAQTETEYLKQELLQQQIAQTKAQTRGQHLDNAARELEIRARIQELTEGKTDIHLINDKDGPIIIFGNLEALEIDQGVAEAELQESDEKDPPE